MKIMLGMTVGLLLALVVLQFTGLGGAKNAEIAQLQKKLDEQSEVKTAPQPNAANSLPNVTSVNNSSAASEELARLREKLEQNEAARKRAEADAARILLKKDAAENAPSPSQAANERKRNNLIKHAILIAKVEAYSADEGLIAIKVINEGNAVEGAILAIRRNDGIAGRVKIYSVDAQEGIAIAEPLAGSFFDDKVTINTGDELIMPPRL